MNVLTPLVLAARLTLAPEPAPLPAPPDTVAAGEGEAAVPDSAWASAVDSVEAQFTYQHGHVDLPNGIASLEIPAGFKFLNEEQARHVVKDLWSNPDANGVMGLILPEQDGVFADSSFAFVVQYDEIGYVKDDDADDIDYDDLLKDLQSGEKEENEQRAQMGYDPAYLIGWAAKPFYDKERKILHWAKELKFGDSAEVNTLNYNVRVLGRKGVLVLNAVAGMPQLHLVEQHIPEVLGIVSFKDGYKYEQFDSSVDEVAAWTIGGLVAGKVLLKAGLWATIGAVLFKLKVLWIGLIAGIGAFFRWITGRKKKQNGPPAAPPTPPAAIS